MNIAQEPVAFGAPGTPPRWTSSAKEGLGTSYHTGCRVWFTLSHGIINEIYYPNVDKPNTRDFQFLVTDGETFCHEEKRDFDHLTEYPEHDCVFYQVTNTERGGRYRIIKQILTDPHCSVVLVHTRIEIIDESLRGKLRVYALLAPHLAGRGEGNSGDCTETGSRPLLHASRAGTHLVMGASCGFSRRSVGYVGASDGWRDLTAHFKMDWEFRSAENGNIALTGELDLKGQDEFTIAVAFGSSSQSTAAKLIQSLAVPFDQHREDYVKQWQRTVVNPKFDFSLHTGDKGGIYRLSRCVLLCHEDKIFQGAMVASMSIPWGESKDDADLGGYHLVWTRDMVQSASALLATGQTSTPLRALIWLASVQLADGSFPQNCWINGTPYWDGLQLDEVAAPIILAWRSLHKGTGHDLFDPCPMIFRAASYLILRGPVTTQERWEENSGYSPSTLATVIAGLVCAANFATDHDDPASADFILSYADWLVDHLEEWMVTQKGELLADYPRYYIRINPTDPNSPDPHADPDQTMITIANGGGTHAARNIVGGDFLQLVRLGIRAADDPIILDSIRVVDRVLKRDMPQGPCWRRYNYDGYGQKSDGSAFNGTGVGRSWPILTGERGHYELAAGSDPLPYITAMEDFANLGGMITEQLWDEEDLPDNSMKRGEPTGSAMPLCWSHAEYISLVRSRHDGVCFDRIEPAYERYVVHPKANYYEIWSLRHALRRMPKGKTLRIVVSSAATIHVSVDGWANKRMIETQENKLLNLWFADIQAENAHIDFTFFWKESAQWEGRNFQVEVTEPAP
jgi:glucoamylase